MMQGRALATRGSRYWQAADDPFRMPFSTHVSQVQVLQACGARFERRRVRVLSVEEGAYVRSGLTQKGKLDYWKHLRDQERLEISRLYRDIPRHNLERLFQKQVAAFKDMELHHVCQIMTCPVDRSPSRNWEQTLEWWRETAHYDLAATHPTLHKLIHRVQDYKILRAFGDGAASGMRASGDFIGDLEITTMPGQVWTFPRLALEQSARRIMERETARKAVVRQQLNEGAQPERYGTMPSRPERAPLHSRNWHPLDCHVKAPPRTLPWSAP